MPQRARPALRQAVQAEVCRAERISPGLVALWKNRVLDQLAALFHDEERLSQEQGRIGGPEQLVGR